MTNLHKCTQLFVTRTFKCIPKRNGCLYTSHTFNWIPKVKWKLGPHPPTEKTLCEISSLALRCSVIIFRMSFIYFDPANCSNPTRPMDGSIEPYQNTTEGAEIFFKCNPGFVPAGRMRAVCGADGRWNPDPAGYRCAGEIMHTVLPVTVTVIMAYGSTPYVGTAPKKMAATLKVHK